MIEHVRIMSENVQNPLKKIIFLHIRNKTMPETSNGRIHNTDYDQLLAK